MSDYYNSLQYIEDKENGIGPPPANQGGPTVWEIAKHEGMVDENGYFTSGRGGHIGTWTNPTVPNTLERLTNQTLNWGAAQQGQTVGGISNTDGWGDPISWGRPQGRGYEVGEVFSTPAGDYNVIKNPWGQFALEPIGEASTSGGPYFNNMTHGGHHVGIDYETGNAWYQGANSIQNNYSGGPPDRQQASREASSSASQNTETRTAPATQSAPRQLQGPSGVSGPVGYQESTPTRGMLSGSKTDDNPQWSALSEALGSQGMGPFMLGQLVKRR
jgi:hypothetical protein